MPRTKQAGYSSKKRTRYYDRFYGLKTQRCEEYSAPLIQLASLKS